MSKYRGPRLRLTRRFPKNNLPGLTRKISDRPEAGQHGQSKSTQRKQESDYKIRLLEKQKLRYNYLLTEHQLLQYVKKAKRMKGATGSLILQFLEMRLDSIVFRLGFAPTIPAARQMVNHGHINVNNKKVNLPSFQCRMGDTISLGNKNSSKSLYSYHNQYQRNSGVKFPSYLAIDAKSLVGKIDKEFVPNEASILINDLLIIEYYSRKC